VTPDEAAEQVLITEHVEQDRERVMTEDPGPSLSSVPGFDSPAAHPEIRQAVDDALNCSVDRCARCKVCDNQTQAVMLEVIGPLLESAHDTDAALARQRDAAMTEAAKLRAKLAAITACINEKCAEFNASMPMTVRPQDMRIDAGDVLKIISDEKEPRA
jgi:hypothetical protein